MTSIASQLWRAVVATALAAALGAVLFSLAGSLLYPLLFRRDPWPGDVLVLLYFALFVAAVATPLLVAVYFLWQRLFRVSKGLRVVASRGTVLGVAATVVLYLFYLLPAGTPYHRGGLIACLALACIPPSLVAAAYLNRHAVDA